MAVLLAPQDSVNMAQAQWLELFTGLFSNGVMAGQLNTYTTTVTGGLGISVASGKALVQGFLARSDAAVALTCAAADPTNPRIDRAVLHCDLSAHTLTVQLLTGTPGVSPSPPALTQTATVWEISVYQVRVNATQTVLTAGSLTDERTYSLANIAAGAILDALMANQKVNRSGDTMTGDLITSGNFNTSKALLYGPGVGGFQSKLAYNSVATNADEYWTPQQGATPLGHLFITWTGAAQQSAFSVGGQFGSAPTYVDNSGNIICGSSQLAATGNVSKLAGQTTAGSFGVPFIVAQALAVTVSTTSDTVVLSYTTLATGLYRVNLSFYVSPANPGTITAFVKYISGNDATNNPGIFFDNGINAVNSLSLAKGEWGLQPITIYALTATAIAIHYQDVTGTPADKINCLIERLS